MQCLTAYFENNSSRLKELYSVDRINKKNNKRVSVIGTAKSNKPSIYMVIVLDHDSGKLEAYNINYFVDSFYIADGGRIEEYSNMYYLKPAIKKNREVRTLGTVTNFNLKKDFEIYFYVNARNLLFAEAL